jgi:hypothetical protein
MPTKTKGYRPVRKITAAALAGAVATIIVFVLNTYLLPEDKILTGEIAAALTTVLAFAAGYFVSPGAGETNITTP